MTFSLRHIILLIGILTVTLSFLWFGPDTDTYNVINLAGLAIASISFLVVLAKKDSAKSKLLWTLIVIACIGMQWLTKPLLIRYSCKRFIKTHESSLTAVTAVIRAQKNDLFMQPSSNLSARNDFTEHEVNEIRKGLENTGIDLIVKERSKIFYRTWGMLDVSHGVYYFYSVYKPDKRYTHIFDNWYY